MYLYILNLFLLQAIEGTIILAILLSRYNIPDITLTKDFYQVSGPSNMNMGTIKGISLDLMISVMIWSILAKALCLGGMRLMKRWLFVLVSIFSMSQSST